MYLKGPAGRSGLGYSAAAHPLARDSSRDSRRSGRDQPVGPAPLASLGHSAEEYAGPEAPRRVGSAHRALAKGCAHALPFVAPRSGAVDSIPAMDPDAKQITLMLQAAAAGDRGAERDLLPLVYERLREIARAKLAHVPPGNTLQPTALVHEAYIRLFGTSEWEGREQFFSAAARTMRNILVDQARRKAALKRGGRHRRVSGDDFAMAIETPSEDMLALDAALQQLETEDPEGVEIVLLRFFAGLTHEQIARIQGVSVRTIERRWRFIRAAVHRLLQEEPGR